LQEICKMIDHPIILLGGKEDMVNGNEIAGVDNVKVYNACGKFGHKGGADLLQKAKLGFRNATGMSHIAAAFKRPITSLWGNTVPSFGMTPYYGDAPVSDVILQTKKLWCRPCSKIGYNKCPLGHFKCMEKIDADEVIGKVKARL